MTDDPCDDWYVIPQYRPLVAEIQHAVAEVFQIPVCEMSSPRRAREVARPRQVAMYLSKQLTLKSLPEIGRMFGGRDHTTVIHAVKQIEKLILIDRNMLAKRDQAISEIERAASQRSEKYRGSILAFPRTVEA